MIGIVLPDGRTGLSRAHQALMDKNYLTPLEIAAILDNQLVTIDLNAAVDFLATLGVDATEPEDATVVEEAVRLANLTRG